MLTSLLLTAVLTLKMAAAHDGGHGAAISGLGPNGGRLAPVVLAKDAELKDKAPAQGLAEWRVDGRKLSVKFWTLDRKTSLLPAKGELKWIVLGKRLEKPEVLKEVYSGVAGELAREISSLPRADGVEIILPGLGSTAEKQVVYLSVKDGMTVVQ